MRWVSAFIVFFLSTSTSGFAIDILEDIPPKCRTAVGARSEDRTKRFGFNFGPSWVEPCVICEDGKKKTAWFARRSCSKELQGMLRYNSCEPTSTPGCFKIVENKSDPRNVDCKARGSKDPFCVDREEEVTCGRSFPDKRRMQPLYRGKIHIGYCSD